MDGINNLETTIDGFSLPKGIEGSLDSKLNLALAALNAGNTPLACSYLQDAINFAQAQSGKKISVSQANAIISAVGAIRTQLGC